MILRRSAELTRNEMVPKALEYLDSIRRFQDLSSVFQQAALPNDRDWPLEMIPQLHLAYAFYLAKSGHEGEARQMMSAWLSRNRNLYRPETLESLSRLFEQAAKSSFILH